MLKSCTKPRAQEVVARGLVQVLSIFKLEQALTPIFTLLATQVNWVQYVHHILS